MSAGQEVNSFIEEKHRDRSRVTGDPEKTNKEEDRDLEVNQVRGVESSETRKTIHTLLNEAREFLNPRK